MLQVGHPLLQFLHQLQVPHGGASHQVATARIWQFQIRVATSTFRVIREQLGLNLIHHQWTGKDWRPAVMEAE